MTNKKSNVQRFLSPTEMERQETLSLERLKALTENSIVDTFTALSSRPQSSFVELMGWVVDNFGPKLAGKQLEKFVHNRIIVDGQFLTFCEENDVKVTCLFKDSIISWKTEHDHEKFFAQGVFLIKAKGVEFLHCALFHKGNQNEDEVGFFVVCDHSNFDKYIELRNKFDTWMTERDRSNLHIRVIDGEDIPYTKDATWEELFLPETIKNDVKDLVENFLASKDFYLEKKIPWKRGILLFGQPGNGKTSIIRTIISQYNFKPVTFVPGSPAESMREAFSYAEEQSPALLYIEDLDSLIENGLDISSFLNLLDGISSKNGLLVIATANDVKKLKTNITRRPSRFDRKFEIPVPDQEMANVYLKKWFGNVIPVAKCRALAKEAEKHGLSYAYLKELYISSMFEALSNNRKVPNAKDIDNTLSRLIREKNNSNGGNEINTDKYFQKG